MASSSKPPTLNDVRLTLRAVLVPAVQNGLTMDQMERDYEGFKAKPIPYRALGFNTLEQLLDSLSDVIVSRTMYGERRYFPISDPKTRHIETLVKEQKSAGLKGRPKFALGGVRPQPPTPTSLTPLQREIKNNIVRMLQGQGGKMLSYTTVANLYQSEYRRKFDAPRMFGKSASVVFKQMLRDVVQTKQDRNGQIFVALKPGVEAAGPRVPRVFPARGNTPQLPYAMVAARQPSVPDPPIPVSRRPTTTRENVGFGAERRGSGGNVSRFDTSILNRLMGRQTNVFATGQTANRGQPNLPPRLLAARNAQSVGQSVHMKPLSVPAPSQITCTVYNSMADNTDTRKASTTPTSTAYTKLNNEDLLNRLGGDFVVSERLGFGAAINNVPSNIPSMVSQGFSGSNFLDSQGTSQNTSLVEASVSTNLISRSKDQKDRPKMPKLPQLASGYTSGVPTMENMKKQVLEILIDQYPEWLYVDVFSSVYRRFYNREPQPEQYMKRSWREVFNAMFEDWIVWMHGGLDGWMLRLADHAAVHHGLVPAPLNDKNIPKPTLEPKEIVDDNLREARRRLTDEIRQILLKYPAGIVGNRFLEVFEQETGRQLNLSRYGYQSITDLFLQMSDTILRTDGVIFDRASVEEERRRKEEAQRRTTNTSPSESEVIERMAAIVYNHLKMNPDSHVKIPEVTQLLKRHGVVKDDTEVMRIFWVHFKSCFQAYNVNGELTVKLNSETTTDASNSSTGRNSTIVSLSRLKKQQEQMEESRFQLATESFPVPNSDKDRFIQIEVAQFNSLFEIWINLRPNCGKIEQLMLSLGQFYSEEPRLGGGKDWSIEPEEVEEGMLCAALYGAYGWHRAQIKRISGDQKELELFYVDYGSVDRVWTDTIRRLDNRFLSLPAQAIPVSLPYREDMDACDERTKEILQKRFFKFMQQVDNGYLWAFSLDTKSISSGHPEVEMILESGEAEKKRIYISQVMQASDEQGSQSEKQESELEEEEADESSLIDLDSDPELDEFEAELQATCGAGTGGNRSPQSDGGESIPSDPDTTATDVPTWATEDSVQLYLRVMEIQKLELTKKLSGGEDVTATVDKLSEIDQEIQSVKQLLVRLGINDE